MTKFGDLNYTMLSCIMSFLVDSDINNILKLYGKNTSVLIKKELFTIMSIHKDNIMQYMETNMVSIREHKEAITSHLTIFSKLRLQIINMMDIDRSVVDNLTTIYYLEIDQEKADKILEGLKMVGDITELIKYDIIIKSHKKEYYDVYMKSFSKLFNYNDYLFMDHYNTINNILQSINTVLTQIKNNYEPLRDNYERIYKRNIKN